MRTGSVIDGRFEIERFAGRGGMGTVYRALDHHRRVPVALKMLGSVGRNDLQRFAREAQILAELRHPGIVRYVAHGETGEGQPYLAMEWLEGVDLDEHLGVGPLDAAESVALARNVAEALGAAHRVGVIHRDVKPSNLFLQGGSTARVKVLDFGIARATTSQSMTRTGLVVGTPGYLSPEQARGSRAIDSRADVFALGCVLFSCLTARPAFVADDVIGLLAKVLVEAAPRVSEIWPEVPPALDALVARMTALDPEVRPRDGAEVARALDALGAMPTEVRGRRQPRTPTLTASEQRLFCVILIAGTAFPSEESLELAAARGDVVLLGDQMRRAFEDLVAGACAEAPLLLVLEDLHWGDVPSVRFVDSILRNLDASPLFVLATARPEVHQIFPSLWHERSVQEIRVGALTPKASEKLVRHVLGEAASRETVERIVARAAGHALHLEEILRVVLEGGGDDALPGTVVAMVQARLEALDPAARRLLRAASVFGRSFWAAGLTALLGKSSAAETREWLEELTAREWIVRTEASRFPGDDEYAFRQDVVREAAYAMLTHVDRALGHRLAGAWLDAAGEDASLILARHFELGGDTPRAAEAYRRAAEQSLLGDDFAAAIEHGERAAQLGAEGEALGGVRAILAEAHLHRGEFEAARTHGDEARGLVTRDDPAWSRAACVVTHATGKLGDLVALKAIVGELLGPRGSAAASVAFAAACSNAVVQLMIGGDKALAEAVHARLSSIAEASPDPAVAGYAARASGVRAAFGGDNGETLRFLRVAIASFEAAGDLRNACSQKKTQGWYAGECGALEEGERALREAIEVAARLGVANLVAHAKNDIGSPLVRLGKLAEAIRYQEEAIAVFAAQGDRRLLCSAHGCLSWALRLQGDLEGAERGQTGTLDSPRRAQPRARVGLPGVSLAGGGPSGRGLVRGGRGLEGPHRRGERGGGSDTLARAGRVVEAAGPRRRGARDDPPRSRGGDGPGGEDQRRRAARELPLADRGERADCSARDGVGRVASASVRGAPSGVCSPAEAS